jgi:transposase InsO family protein
VSYIVDVFSRIIVGWRVAVHRRTDIVLAAVEMASWSRVGLVARSDADSRFTSRRCGERLAELGATPSIGSVGDSFDSALVESTIGLHNSKLIRGRAQSCGEPGRGTRVSTSGPSASSRPDGHYAAPRSTSSLVDGSLFCAEIGHGVDRPCPPPRRAGASASR